MKNIAEASNSNLVPNVNALLTKSNTKIYIEVEFSWVNNMHLQNQTRFNLGVLIFFRNKHCFSRSTKC